MKKFLLLLLLPLLVSCAPGSMYEQASAYPAVYALFMICGFIAGALLGVWFAYMPRLDYDDSPPELSKILLYVLLCGLIFTGFACTTASVYIAYQSV